MKRSISFFLFSLFLSTAQALTPVVDSIPMSDGRKLAADIYIPSGMSSGPVILIQTPYNRQIARLSGLPLGIGQNIASSNYIFVITDWRGFYGSARSAYPGNPDRGRDGYSTVEWIASQTWSNGKIGTWGPSALGKVQYQTARTRPPHLSCICPLVAAPQFDYLEYYPNGALRTEYVEQLDELGFGLSSFLLAHPYKDNVWNFTEAANTYYDSIAVPALLIGGWYDHNTQLMMDCFKQLQAGSHESVRDKHKLLMGPWVHGGHGSARVGSEMQGELSYPDAADANDIMALAFFDRYLRDVNNGWESRNAYTWYQMGSQRWEGSNTWPPAGSSSLRLYLHGNGSLLDSVPVAVQSRNTFVYDPSDPSPTLGGPTLRNDLSQGPYDQRNGVENRNDLLSYTSPVLSSELQMNGNVRVALRVSSDRPDTDFDVRLCDVYPDGRSMLINDAVFRMRFRNGFAQSQTAMMQAGQVYDCNLTLPATAITLPVGHRLRLLVSSSNYPRFNRNMNNGADMYPGKSTDSLLNPLIAGNTVYCEAGNASFLTLPVRYPLGLKSDGETSSYRLMVYPNPAHGPLRVSVPDAEGFQLLLYDFQGRIVLDSQVKGEETILNLQNLARGLYYIRAFAGSQVMSAVFVRQ